MATLVIGDLHFDTKPVGILEAQENAVKQLIWRYKDKVDDFVFLGDLMMHRRPYPSVLLALQRVLDEIPISKNVYILRGNHDSENKTDDGITALSLFRQNHIWVIKETSASLDKKKWLIPHYESEERIISDLERAPDNSVVFGHFGYNGCLNSAGDNDFNLNLDHFRNTTILGHIHHFSSKKGFNQEKQVITLGTPYTTSFNESRKDCYVAFLEGEEIRLDSVDCGPRHITINIEDIPSNVDFLNDPNYFTMLRVMLNSLEESTESVTDALKDLKVAYVETKYRRVYHEEYDVGTYDTENSVNEITDDIIEEYINSSDTELSKEELMSGLKTIYENQKLRSQ